MLNNRQYHLISYSFLIASAIFLCFCWFRGLDNVLRWDVLSELSEIPFLLDKPTEIHHSAPLVVPSFVVTEQYVAGLMQVQPWVIQLFSGLLVMALLLALVHISTLKGFWFYGYLGLCIMALISLRIDVFFGFSSPVVSLALALLYGGMAFFLQSYRADFQYFQRFFCYIAITLPLMGLAINFRMNPEAIIAYHALPVAMLCTLGFLFYVAPNALKYLLYLATNTPNKQSLFHFNVIALFYLGNLVFTWLHNTKTIDWDILYVSPFLLILFHLLPLTWLTKQGAWGKNTLATTHLGIIAFATAAFAFGTGNDPLIEALEDAIVYTHTIVGALFLLFVVINFGPIFSKGMAVYKVLDRPIFMAWDKFQIAAALIILIFLQQNHFFPIWQGVAGYYNALGDYYADNQNFKLSEVYYKQGLGYEYQNHKSNYALASLALKQGDNATAGVYMKQALLKKPSAYAYAGLSRCLQNEDSYFNALFTLREGLQKFPDVGELSHNLGYLFAKTGGADSAKYYYQKAEKTASLPEVSKSNILAMGLKNNDLSTPVQDFTGAKYNAFLTNILAYKNQMKVFEKDIFEPSELPKPNLIDMAYAHNFTLNQIALPTPQIPLDYWNKLAEGFSADITKTKAIEEYYKGDKLLAFDLLKPYTDADTSQSLPRTLLAFWLEKEANTPITDTKGGIERHPFNPVLMTQVVANLNKQNRKKEAYELLLRTLRVAPKEVGIKKIYIMQCLELYLKDYAQDAMNELPDTDYQEMMPIYRQKLALMEKARADF